MQKRLCKKHFHNLPLCILLVLSLLIAPASNAAAEMYHSYSDLMRDMAGLEQNHPGLVKVHEIGHSVEGRTIVALKISDNPSVDEDEPEVLFVGGHHAREWISVEVAFHLARYLVENYASSNRIGKLIDRGEIWIIPMLNPDGHEYSRTTERFWRKNRRNNGDGTFGVDLNRNYDFAWNGTGSSEFTLDDTYRGPHPFSEPETRALRDLILASEFKALTSYHSYGQLILYPWAYHPLSPSDNGIMGDMAQKMSNVIYNVHRRTYRTRQTYQYYPLNGDLTDWAYGTLGILAFTVELRPDSVMDGGFKLPEDQIAPTVAENIPAALYLIERTQQALDLVFVVDTSASMRTPLPQVQTSLMEAVKYIDSSLIDYRIAVVDYRDFPDTPYGQAGDYPYRAVLPFSSDKEMIIAAIQGLAAGGEGDVPGSVYSALMRAAKSEGLGGWREGVDKSIILVGDAPPHDPEPFTGYSLADVVAAAGSVASLAINSMALCGDPAAMAYFSTLSDSTGGEFFSSLSPPETLAASKSAIQGVIGSPVIVGAGKLYSGTVGTPISFDAVSSYDPDGRIVLYEWDFDDDGIWDATETAPVANYTYDSAYSGTVKLRITDQDGFRALAAFFVEATSLDCFDNDRDGYTTCGGDCDDANPDVNPGAGEICDDFTDNNCNSLVDMNDLECLFPCSSNWQCGEKRYCGKSMGNCGGTGACAPLPSPAVSCPLVLEPVCGCDGATYQNGCEAETRGVSVAAMGPCPDANHSWRYYFPAIRDGKSMEWENYLTVLAREPVPMDVTIHVFDMNGTLKGTFVYSDTDPRAQAPTVAPHARVALKPSMIAGTTAEPVDVEGSMIVETSVPAIATTSTISYSFEGFSIVESARPRSIHLFPKAFDGPNNYEVYILVQNIHDRPMGVTASLIGKNTASPGHGARKTYRIPSQGTLKFRPSDVAGGIDFSGSVVVTSDGTTPGDGLGPAIPAACGYELGKEAMTIYESTLPQPALYFPTIRDGKFGGVNEHRNYLSVVNPGMTDVRLEVILHGHDGLRKATTGPITLPRDGKITWRPSMILGTVAAPIDFEGAVVVMATAPVMGQTNTIHPGANSYLCDAFDLIESAIPSAGLLFPKAFDNLAGEGRLYDNLVYVQNPDGAVKNIRIKQFNSNGVLNGSLTVPLGPNATYVFRPRDLVKDGTNQFRGSIRVTETTGAKITGAIKYEIHQGSTSATPVDAMTLYRSMGQ